MLLQQASRRMVLLSHEENVSSLLMEQLRRLRLRTHTARARRDDCGPVGYERRCATRRATRASGRRLAVGGTGRTELRWIRRYAPTSRHLACWNGLGGSCYACSPRVGVWDVVFACITVMCVPASGVERVCYGFTTLEPSVIW
eukprot:scaffold97630_cov69-Phaeocystis_antarctica.AAC.6